MENMSAVSNQISTGNDKDKDAYDGGILKAEKLVLDCYETVNYFHSPVPNLKSEQLKRQVSLALSAIDEAEALSSPPPSDSAPLSSSHYHSAHIHYLRGRALDALSDSPSPAAESHLTRAVKLSARAPATYW